MSWLGDLWSGGGGGGAGGGGGGGGGISGLLSSLFGSSGLLGGLGTLGSLGVGAYGLYNAATADRGGAAGAGVPGTGELQQIAGSLGPEQYLTQQQIDQILADLRSQGGGVDALMSETGASREQLKAILEQIPGQTQQQQSMITDLMGQVSTATDQLSAEQRARIDPIVQSLVGQYSEFIQPLSTGVLPPGAEQAVANATKAAKDSISSRYAQLGISGSSSEAEALGQVEERAVGERFNIAQQMAQQANTAIGQAINAMTSETSTDVSLLQYKYGSLEKLIQDYGLAGQTGIQEQLAGVQIGASLTDQQLKEMSLKTGITEDELKAISERSQTSLAVSSLQQRIYQSLMEQTIGQNKDLQSALASFANALGRAGSAGRTGTITFS